MRLCCGGRGERESQWSDLEAINNRVARASQSSLCPSLPIKEVEKKTEIDCC